MNHLADKDVLSIWEYGYRLSWTGRALLILTVSYPDAAPEELAALSVGKRDELLLGIYDRLFGSVIESMATCPHCSELLETQFSVSDVLGSQPPNQQESVFFEHEDYLLQIRPVNSLDVTSLGMRSADVDVQTWLIERCVEQAHYQDEPIAVSALPTRILEQVEAVLAEIDPLADIRVALNCPACEETYAFVFDIVPILWNKIVEYSRRLMLEIHTLARFYGWSEQEVLSLSGHRRRMYLEMVLNA